MRSLPISLALVYINHERGGKSGADNPQFRGINMHVWEDERFELLSSLQVFLGRL